MAGDWDADGVDGIAVSVVQTLLAERAALLYRSGNVSRGWSTDFRYDGTLLVAEYSGSDGSLLQHFAYSAEGLNQRRGTQHRLFTFDPDGNLVNRLTASPVNPLSITWHNRLGVVYQDQLASTGQLVDVPNAGTVGYQGYFGVYSDANTRTMGQARFAALVTLNTGRHFDPVTAQGMQRDFGAVNPYARLYRQRGSLADRLTNLVLSWADAGWTAGDPSAAEGAAFVKAVGALQRTIGTAWEIQNIASLPRLAAGLTLAASEVVEEGGSLLRAGYEWARRGVVRRLSVPVYRMVSTAEMEAMKAAGGLVPSLSSRGQGLVTRIFLREQKELMIKYANDPFITVPYDYIAEARVWRWGLKRSILGVDARVRGKPLGFVVHVPTINRYLAAPLRFEPIP